MDIKRTVEKLMRKYNTNDPFKLAEKLNIIVKYDDLGNTWGYFITYKRIKIIHINNNIEEWLQRYTCAHELGHSILHKGVPTPFLKKHTLFSIDKIERQANTFAVELLMPDKVIAQYEGYTVHNVADIVGIPNGLEVLKK